MVCAGRRWAGESLRCEDPAPTVGIAERSLRCMALSGIYAIAGINRNGIEVDNDAPPSTRPNSAAVPA